MPDPPTATATNATEPKTAPTIIAVGVEVLASAGLGGNTFGVVPGTYRQFDGRGTSTMLR